MERAEHNPQNPEQSPSIGEYFSQFRQSSLYAEALNSYFAGKSLDSDVTEAEKIVSFEGSQNVKLALLQFHRDVQPFTYESERYSDQVRAAIAAYVDYVRLKVEAERAGADRAEREAMDVKRTELHYNLAETLVDEGHAPSIKLARQIGRIILIIEGLDTYSSAQEPDSVRLRRVAGQ